jgi:hydrogenase expression/formation protein HypD
VKKREKELDPEMMQSLLRNEKAVRGIAAGISRLASARGARIMHVCGSHEHTATRFGLRALLPANVDLIAGPGCPVCVCSSADIHDAIEVARKGAIIATFGDMMRDRTPHGSLEDAKAGGADVRMVYSPLDAIQIAKDNRDREVVFFGVGFETTAAPVASMVSDDLPANFSMLTSFKLTSPAVEALLKSGKHHLDGIIAPGHVSTVVGAVDWARFPEKYGVPAVVAGFEPADLLLAVLKVMQQMEGGKPRVENEYTRLVRFHGNPLALRAMKNAFDVKPAFWRGVGTIPDSGLFLRDRWAGYDTRKKLDVHSSIESEKDLPKGCHCDEVIVGELYPNQCPLFGKKCTPSSPYGPCMVSGEGTCYIWHRFGDPKKLKRPRTGRK